MKTSVKLSNKSTSKNRKKNPIQGAVQSGAKKKQAVKNSDPDLKKLSKPMLLQMHDLMVKSRVLEERLIKAYKAGDSYFWIGGPGEEAWGVSLGLQINKGQGIDHDFLHFHYRCTPTLVAMGMPMIDAIRLNMNRVTDPHAGGRNFSGHYCYPKWNVAPVTSPIGVQYAIAIGTAHVQKKNKAKGITIVSGGDAGSAEGDFASCLVWASRKNQELPMLITVQNNKWGISTNFDGQHGETHIADRARGFNIRARVVNGNDPIESWIAIQEELSYIRKTGKPAFIESMVSRLFGHSSASGANFISHEQDPVKDFEQRLLKADFLKEVEAKKIWKQYEDEGYAVQQQVREEPGPTADSVWDHVFVNNENGDWRKY